MDRCDRLKSFDQHISGSRQENGGTHWSLVITFSPEFLREQETSGRVRTLDFLEIGVDETLDFAYQISARYSVRRGSTAFAINVRFVGCGLRNSSNQTGQIRPKGEIPKAKVDIP